MQVLLAAVLAASVALAVSPPATASPSGSDLPKTLHVARAAQAPGDGSSARPYPRIAQALAVAMPGDTVLVGRGRYAEEVRTVRPGRPGAPIRVVGRPGTHLAGPHGRARGRLVQVLHDYVTLQSLELSDANILVWVQGASHVRLLGSRLHDAGGECVRLKGSAQANEVAGNVSNRSTRHAGAGIRLGGDKPGQGVGNDVVGNTLTDNAGYGLKVMRRPQGRIAGNTFARNRRGRTNQKP